MKIVAVDFGDSHTGIAASDFMEMLATPVCIIDEKRFEVCADKVAEKDKGNRWSAGSCGKPHKYERHLWSQKRKMLSVCGSAP